MKKILAVMIALSGAVFAEKPSLKGAWEIGPYAGVLFFDEYNATNPPNDDIIGGRLGYFFTDRFSAEGSYQRAFATGFNADSARLNLLYHLTSGTMFRPFFTVGTGWERTAYKGLASENDIGLNAGGGLKLIIANKVGLRVDGRYNTFEIDGPVGGQRQHNGEVLVGLSWFFGAKKPAPVVKDADNDGVNDEMDKCPGTGAGVKVDATGCAVDEDNDGVLNGADKCPGTAAGVKVDATGCEPKAEIPDSDQDGVKDDQDQCPGTVPGIKVDEKGCPADEDNDGVLNTADRCAKTPAGVKVDAEGCPEQVKKVRGILKGINFNSGKATLLGSSKPVLDEAAKILRDIPDAKIEIQGHSDNTGADDFNLKLSEARAKTVMDYLVNKGVTADRLTSKGYGETMPMSDNKTKQGRADNRRVVFKWLDETTTPSQ